MFSLLLSLQDVLCTPVTLSLLILIYLLYNSEQFYNDELRELLMYWGTVAWMMMNKGIVPPPNISDDLIEQIEKNNLNMFEYLVDEDLEELDDTIKMVLKDYNQPHLLASFLDGLFEDDEIYIDEDSKVTFIIVIKTIIDCLDS